MFPLLTRRRTLSTLGSLCLLTLFSVWLAISTGSLSISPRTVLSVILGQADINDRLAWEIIIGLRLPRALAALACGGLLALAGALMQILLRNPLADPYLLGTSGGANIGALGALYFGLPLLAVNTFAFAGALAAMLIVFGLAHGSGGWTQTRLLLTGVIVASGCGAVVALILSLSPERQLQGMLFWLMGDLAHNTDPVPACAAIVVITALILPFARELNLLARGEDTALTLGVTVGRLRIFIYLAASLATAIAVTSAGSIGFIGLVVPHLVRLATGNDQRLLLPAAVLAGGALLNIADVLARTIVAPQQLPVGVLTALIGVPIFLFLLSRNKA